MSPSRPVLSTPSNRRTHAVMTSDIWGDRPMIWYKCNTDMFAALPAIVHMDDIMTIRPYNTVHSHSPHTHIHTSWKDGS